MKNPDVKEYFTSEGMVKCVAFYMLEDLPEGELMQNDDGPLNDSDGK